jgi:hypothetical protein
MAVGSVCARTMKAGCGAGRIGSCVGVVARVLLLLVGLLLGGGVMVAGASAVTAAPGWFVASFAVPSNFASSATGGREAYPGYRDEIDRVTVDAAGGTFTVTVAVGGKEGTTAPLACDAPAATVQGALEALGVIGAGNVTVAGGAEACSETNTSAYVVSFDGELSGVEAKVSAAGGALTGTVRQVAARTLQQGAVADSYRILVSNVGAVATTEGAKVSDTLPPGLRAVSIEGELVSEWGNVDPQYPVRCTLATLVCTLPSVASLETVEVRIFVVPTSGASALVSNVATVESGGAPRATSTGTTSPNTVNAPTPTPFGFGDFNMITAGEEGTVSSLAGGHPYSVTAMYSENTYIEEFPRVGSALAGGKRFEYAPVGHPKNVIVRLPLGFLGDPLATAERCSEVDLNDNFNLAHNACPTGSKVGYIVVEGPTSEFLGSRSTLATGYSPVYNMAPERGYPAELGVAEFGQVVFLYANVVRSGSGGYELEVEVPGFPRAAHKLRLTSLTLFGDPVARDGVASVERAFFTNPVDCSAGSLSARLEADSWQEPGNWVGMESVVYPSIGGCGPGEGLVLAPSLSMVPSRAGEGGSTQADEPSAYTTVLRVPQQTVFGGRATPELRDVTVTLPEGLSVSPSAAEGRAGCPERGPEGIDMPSGRGHPDEAGEGEEIGPDGLAHLAAGHCPDASILGTVEACTPLLANRANGEGVKEEGEQACEEHVGIAPLRGHVYLAQPKCGGAGQVVCTEASARNGELYGLYIEVAGEGVVVKLFGRVAADPHTGRLTAAFKDNPQLPFGELRLRLDGGPRAALANPQACGSFAASSDLSAWSGGLGGTPDVVGSGMPFTIDWDGAGGACPAGLPFAPSFSAGTVSRAAGAYSPVSVTLTRRDREQYVSSVQVKTPPGLLGMLSHVSLCPEPRAAQGTCGRESEIGTTTVSAGPGEHPLYLSGRVYLTGPYDGAPFGLSVVVPTVAGPFNLGNVVVRAAIAVDPGTAALTVKSGPLPQIIDGVPTRLRTINVNVNRPEFTFNATSCTTRQITATLTGAEGASAAVASPYAASGCASLPFKPSFVASTQAQASKANGASLTVRVSQRPGEANIGKVLLQLPVQLPSRLTTLQQACTEAQFDINPAGCPAGSVIGTATAITPTLNVPLTGPAILVSHGGAAFPDVEFILQGQGVTIVLDGKTQIKNGITYSKFETVPDAPVSSFETVLPQGPHSILATNLPVAANHNLCGQKLAMPTIITAQNGAQVTQTTMITVRGCKSGSGKQTVGILRARLRARTGRLLLTLKTSSKGRIKIFGRSVETKTRRRVRAGRHRIGVRLSATGRIAARHHEKIGLRVSLTAHGHRVVKRLRVRL